jgi:hypothetical protein
MRRVDYRGWGAISTRLIDDARTTGPTTVTHGDGAGLLV